MYERGVLFKQSQLKFLFSFILFSAFCTMFSVLILLCLAGRKPQAAPRRTRQAGPSMTKSMIASPTPPSPVNEKEDAGANEEAVYDTLASTSKHERSLV